MAEEYRALAKCPSCARLQVRCCNIQYESTGQIAFAIADLDALHSRPVIARALAKLLNNFVVPLPDARATSPRLWQQRCMGDIASAPGALISSMAEALTDNQIDSEEQVQFLDNIDKVMRIGKVIQRPKFKSMKVVLGIMAARQEVFGFILFALAQKSFTSAMPSAALS